MVLIFLLLMVAGYFGWKTDTAQRKFVYNWPYAREIHLYSAQYRVDPFLAVAVIKMKAISNRRPNPRPGPWA